MIVFPAIAAAVALCCALYVGWDALRRPRPARAIWTVAFLVFAIAAACEVIGAAMGWSFLLARLYYLTGAVLVVGILALGEVYLLLPDRVPAIVPGLALLVAAFAATLVWSAPIDTARLAGEGWRAIERGPLLVTLAVAINAGGTAVLTGGTVYSAWRAHRAGGSRRRAAGCLFIAVGTVTVALGGTLTRFGRPELLYVAMAAGIAVIFAGVLLTRPQSVPFAGIVAEPARARLIPLPARVRPSTAGGGTEGIEFIVENFLSLDDEALGDACRQWSATPFIGKAFSREQARRVWFLRCELPAAARPRFDRLAPAMQAQLAELYAEVFAMVGNGGRAERHG